MTRLEDEPLGWRELCAKLRTTKDLNEFRALLDQINRILTAHEKAHPEPRPDKTPKSKVSPRKRQKLPKATAVRSAEGFMCNCMSSLVKDANVEVILSSGGEHYAGRARVVRKESSGTPWQRYGFQFVEKTPAWPLQEKSAISLS